MSETSEQPETPPSQTTRRPPQRPMGRGTVAVAAILLALPALVPLLVLINPELAPFVGEVDTNDTGLVAFLVGLSGALLLLNWGLLFVIYRWLQRLMAEQSSQGPR